MFNPPREPGGPQLDTDADGLGDACDLCPADPIMESSDLDRDGVGDRCDPDRDGDGVANGADTCPDRPDAHQLDTDADGVGDFCDNCVSTPNPAQADADADGLGDACESVTVTWAPYVGSVEGVVDLVGGLDAVLRLGPAPRASTSSASLLADPESAETMSSQLTRGLDPVPGDFVASELEASLAACDLAPFTDADLTQLLGARRPAGFRVGAWWVFHEAQRVFAVLRITPGQLVRWVVLSPISTERRPDGSLRLSAPAPLSDFGRYLAGGPCGP